MQIFFLVILEVPLFGLALINCDSIMDLGMIGFVVIDLIACFINIIIIFNSGNLLRYGYCFYHKLQSFPIIIYPLAVIKNEENRYKLKVICNMQTLFRILVPSQIVIHNLKNTKNSVDENNSTNVFLKSLSFQFMARIMMIIVLILVESIILQSSIIFLYGANLIILQIILSGVFSTYYVGERALKSQLVSKNDFFISYLISQLPLHSLIEHELYSDYEKHLVQRKEILSCDWTLEALSQMFVLDHSRKITLTEEFNHYIQKNISALESIQGATPLWYFLTLHMNWALVNKSQEDLLDFIHLVRKVKAEYESVLWWLVKTQKTNFFKWHINVAQNQTICINRFGKARYKMLKRDYISTFSKVYRECYKSLSEVVWVVCIKKFN